jgi:chemotaxis protein MotB
VRDGVEIQIGGSLAFARFGAEVKMEAVSKLSLLAEQLKGTNNKIEIRGHATLEPLPPDSPFKDQRDLSYARAKAIGAKLSELGLRDRRFTFVAVGTAEPLKSQAYDEDRMAKNRRVEIVVKESLVSDYEGEPISFEESQNDAH